MDLLFKRYASPFLIIDQMIEMNCFSDFINQSIQKQNDDTLWEFFLHKVEGKTFKEFKDDFELQNTQVTTEDLETTINYSVDLLQGFNPQEN